MAAGRWAGRRVAAVALVLGTLVAANAAWLAVGSPAYADSSSAARRLAEMYSPVVMLQDYHAVCEG